MHSNLMFSLAFLGTLVTGTFVVFLLRRRLRQRQGSVPSYASTSDTEKPAFKDAEDHTDTRSGPLPYSVTSITDGISRDQWVLRMTRHVFNERHNRLYNVLVINDDLEYHFLPKRIVEDISVTYRDNRRTVPYRVVTFTEGTLLNLGDGGDINWDWMGNFVRHHDSMLSFSPCESGVKYQQDAWVAIE